MEELPKSVCVLGGGYIATELGQMLAGLGVKDVSLVVRSQMLRFLEDDIKEALEKEIDRSGVKLMKGSAHKSVHKTEDGMLCVTLENGTEIKCEKVLAAIGRPPNTDPLQLEKAGLSTDKGGFIEVDEF